MRAILAGLFVFGGLLATVAVLGAVGALERLPPPLLGLSLALLTIGLCVAALGLFNSRGPSLTAGTTLNQQVKDLEMRGLLEEHPFVASRAFAVEEFEDEGLHYFIELGDGRVLFMSGQYLYDYEPGASETGGSARRFPCSEFVVRRHKEEGFVVDIQCLGQVLTPEVTTESFGEAVWRNGEVPADGTIITDASYEELKRERMRRAG